MPAAEKRSGGVLRRLAGVGGLTRGVWIRSVEARDLIDAFLVCTVTTILVVRLFLVITGYPQLGGSGLHIAHLLWGGMLMLVAVVLTVSLLTRSARWLAVVAGGVGFGLFIDEVGKFVTADNDYFFRPAYSIIYVVLIVFWLLTRRLFVTGRLSGREATANALEYLKESSIRDLNQAELRRAHELLDAAGEDRPLTREIRALLDQVDAIPAPPPRRATRLLRRVRDWYLRVATRRWSRWAVIAIFVLLTATNLTHIVSIAWTAIEAAGDPGATLDSVDDAVNGRRLGFSGWATLGGSVVVVACNALGIAVLVRRARLRAYRWFERGVLVNIFFVQVFDFADLQLKAFGTLAFNLLVLVTLRLMIAAEESEERAVEERRVDPAPAYAFGLPPKASG